MSSHSHLATLPPEILAHIVQEVAMIDDEEEEVAAGKTYLYERSGTPYYANLAALFEVNMLFWELSKPTLWKTINLDNCSNADLLYLIAVILPRHGPHIRAIRGLFLGDEGPSRNRVPKYIGEALRILPRLQNVPQPTTDSVDHEVLGEALVLPFSMMPTYDRYLERAEGCRAQRLRLLYHTFRHSSTSNVIELGMVTDLGERTNDQYLHSIRQALAHRQLKTIKLNLVDESPVPLESDSESRLSSALAQLIIAHQGSLKNFSAGFGVDEDQTGAADSLLRMVQVFETIAGLPKLLHIKAVNIAILPPLISSQWSCPLRRVTISDLWVDWEDCLAFLSQFSATLEAFDVCIYGRPLLLEEGTGPSSTLISQVSFPRLREIIIGGNNSVEVSVMSSFRGSPVANLLTFLDEGIPYLDWINLFDTFRSTLKRAGGSKFSLTDEEVDKLQTEATSRGISFDASWHTLPDE